jgi:hypothetical protein
MNVNRSPDIPVRAFIGQGCPIYRGDKMSEEIGEVVYEEPPPRTAAEETTEEAEFDQLRRKSARTSAAQGEMREAEPGGWTPGQRLIIALLVLLNIIVIGFGILVLTGRFAL